MEDTLNTIVNLALSGGIAIISFFLKRSYDKLDNCVSKEKAREIETDVTECKTEIKRLSEKYATKEELAAIKERMDKLDDGMEFLKENSVRKGDFIRVTTEISGKLDTLSDYMRGKANG